MREGLEPRIEEFRKRLETEREFCEELFEYCTVRLLAMKYAYYVCSNSFVKDITYDGTEESWYIMGRALDKLKEDETSPCVDFNYEHPLADRAIELAKQLMGK